MNAQRPSHPRDLTVTKPVPALSVLGVMQWIAIDLIAQGHSLADAQTRLERAVADAAKSLRMAGLK